MNSLQEINAMSVDEFVRGFGDIAEHSPWVSELAWRSRPFASVDAVVDAFRAAVVDADYDTHLALIRAHPDLAGRAALAGELAVDSNREQAGAGLDTLTNIEFQRFTSLNERYKSRFGFPFILAVKGADKFQILDAFEARIANGEKDEFDTALKQVLKIISFRLRDRIG